MPGLQAQIGVRLGGGDGEARVDDHEARALLLGVHDGAHEIERRVSPGFAPQTTTRSGVVRPVHYREPSSNTRGVGAEDDAAPAGQPRVAVPPGADARGLGQARQPQIGAELGRAAAGAAEHPADGRPAVAGRHVLKPGGNDVKGLIPEIRQISLPPARRRASWGISDDRDDR